MFVAIPHETVYLAKIVFIRSYCDFFINYALLFGLRTLRSVFVQVNNQIVANRHRVVTPPFLVGYANFPAARSRPSRYPNVRQLMP